MDTGQIPCNSLTCQPKLAQTSRCVRSSVGPGFDSVESLFFCFFFSGGGAGIMTRRWEKCKGLFNLCVHSSPLGKEINQERNLRARKKFKGEKEKTKRMRKREERKRRKKLEREEREKEKQQKGGNKK